jgi:hypothetical protein
VAECVEHIAAAEDFIRGMAVEVMKAPAAPDRDIAKIDAGIMAMIPDRSQKAQAPDELKPTNRFGSPEGSLRHFAESRTATENFLKDTPDLRAHAVDSPIQWSGSRLTWLQPYTGLQPYTAFVIPSEVSKWRAPVKFSDCRSLNRLKRPCRER